jgi:phosphoribosyl 1,2-cyclic phosphodiesterase
MTLHSFNIAHDAVDPVSFTISSGAAKVGLATDLGKANDVVKTRLAGSNALILESNYCPEMLMNSSYPPQIRQRIRSNKGHLSNQDMASLLHHLLHDALRTVVLVHISENNNAPELVRRMAEGVLRGHGATLHVAEQDAPTPLIEVVP